MSHARSGLPPLNLEPFDPTPLYAAARSPRPDNHKQKRSPVITGVLAMLLLALTAGAAFFLI
ncbi:MAG TPA: hypothetical protein VD764_02885 [Nocardioides sp.]|nr:hypothetical protein [Nocardioides sp.]